MLIPSSHPLYGALTGGVRPYFTYTWACVIKNVVVIIVLNKLLPIRSIYLRLSFLTYIIFLFCKEFLSTTSLNFSLSERVFSSVQSLSRVWLFVTPWTAACQSPCPSSTPGACSNSCTLRRWCHPTISFSVIPFSCLQPFPASGSFPMSQFFASGGQSIGASTSFLQIQDWLPLRLTGLISLLSKGLSRLFSNTTVQKHQFLSTQLSLWSNSHTHMWYRS